jgi:hypothetical protein
MKMKDTLMVCIQCGSFFTFSGREQQRILRHSFDPPSRCHPCRKHKLRVDDRHVNWRSRRRSMSRNGGQQDDFSFLMSRSAY